MVVIIEEFHYKMLLKNIKMFLTIAHALSAVQVSPPGKTEEFGRMWNSGDRKNAM